MSIMEAEIQWFIARDGKQHGPVSDLEMRKLVELGHLRPSDLLWRQGFPDWRPAPAVFVPQPLASLQPRSQMAPQPGQARVRTQQTTTSPRYESTGGRAASAALQAGTMQGARQSQDPSTGGRRAAARYPNDDMGEQRLQAPQRVQPDPVGLSDTRAPRRRGRRALATLLILSLVGGGGWFAYTKRIEVTELGGRLVAFVKSKAKERAPAETENRAETHALAAGQSGDAQKAEAQPQAEAAAALDARLQKTPHWMLIRQEFSGWYQDRLKEASRLAAGNKPAPEVSAYLTQGLVDLRRANADKALAASSATLKGMASAFLANVGRLSQESTDACMAFILKGEASPPVVQIIDNPEKNAEINAHFQAIFSAVGEGTRTPHTHAEPSEADYQLLVAQLTKLGWSQADLQLFADPKGPMKTSAERYCKMMHEFFAAHLAVEDASAQERLLYRTLKLVVAG